MRTNKNKNEIHKTKKLEEKFKRKDLKFETKKYICDFHQYQPIRSFGASIYTCKSKILEVEEDLLKNIQGNLLKNIVEFNNKSRPKTK